MELTKVIIKRVFSSAVETDAAPKTCYY